MNHLTILYPDRMAKTENTVLKGISAKIFNETIYDVEMVSYLDGAHFEHKKDMLKKIKELIKNGYEMAVTVGSEFDCTHMPSLHGKMIYYVYLRKLK